MEIIIKDILKKEKISYKKLEKATSGFTNVVYFIDDKYVIKMSKDENIKKKLNKETSIYKNIKIDNIPKFVACGSVENYSYLIITKLKGKSLFYIWHLLDENQRKSCIKQIANILKSFNNQSAQFLSDEYKFLDWECYIKENLIKILNSLTNINLDVSSLKNFINLNLKDLFKENKFGLVYNDAHFDNFIYDNGKINLIDFDRVIYAPIDYEMLIYKTMYDLPHKFTSEDNDDLVVEETFKNIYPDFKYEYPEMFTCKNVEERIFVYQFIYIVNQAIKCNDLELINKQLNKFNKMFNVNVNIK